MELFGQAVSGVQLAVLFGLIALQLGVKSFAVVDAVRHPAGAYPAAGKRTKNLWLLIVGFSLAVNVLLWANPLGLLNIAGFVAAVVYLVDVRPAVVGVQRGDQRW